MANSDNSKPPIYMKDLNKSQLTISGRVTLADVAKAAGVSTSAVSRTFTPGASVAKKTRTHILKVATNLGYRPNAIARTLSTQRSRIIGLVVSYLHNQFYPTIIERLSQHLQAQGYHVLLFISGDHSGAEAETDSLVLDILQYQVDGLVLMSTTMSSRLAMHCHTLGIPVVMLNRTAPIKQVNAVSSNNYEGGRLAARFFINAGAHRISFIGGLKNASTTVERQQGFIDELLHHDISPHSQVYGNYDFHTAGQVTQSLFTTKNPPDALFVANDHMAFSVLDVLRSKLGIAVPDDVQVIGFDNVPQASWRAYYLTTVEQNAEQMVKHTITTLLDSLKSPTAEPRQIVVPVKLIERGTTWKLP